MGGCALADDMLITCDKPEHFKKIIKEFDNFLHIVGLSLNPSKCHYTTHNTVDKPVIRIADHKRRRHVVEWKSPKIPVKYLGYSCYRMVVLLCMKVLLFFFPIFF